MPEYLAPGVYVEEVSFRSKSIEGVPTSTTGFAGMTRYGPVAYPNGPLSVEPRLMTSFTEFERMYGGLEHLRAPAGEDRIPYTPHAARAFFMNGGKRLYISRVFTPRGTDWGVASLATAVSGTTATWRARWPGEYGNALVKVIWLRSKNLAFDDGGTVQIRRARHGAMVEIFPPGPLPVDTVAPVIGNLAEIDVNPATGKQRFSRGGAFITPAATDQIVLVELTVQVWPNGDVPPMSYTELGVSPNHKRYIGKILQREDPEDEAAVVWLDWDPGLATGNDRAANLMVALCQKDPVRLQGGHDGNVATASDLKGKEADPDVVTIKATGLAALGDIDDIAIVALPDSGTLESELEAKLSVDYLIAHAENLKYRIAVVDGREQSSMTEIRRYRGQFDSKYAAFYHPWIEILDPIERATQGAPPMRILLPPSGFATGIYARSDI